MFKYLPAATLAGSILAGYTTIHKHTFGLSFSKKRLSYFPTEEKPFDEGTQKVIDEMTDYALMGRGLDTVQVAGIHYFWSNMPNMTHLGSTNTKNGSHIGIPINFIYKTRSEIDPSKLTSGDNVAINPSSDVTDSLLDSLLLSENAKRFAIASELHMVDTVHVWEKFSFLGVTVGGYSTGYYMRNFLAKKSNAFQLAFLCSIVFVWLTIYYKIQEIYGKSIRINADKTAAEIDKGVLEGGLEYISKLIKRNQALRVLNGQLGPLQYKENGNEIQKFYEISRLSLTERMKLLERLKTSLDDKTNEASETSDEESLTAKLKVINSSVQDWKSS